MIQYLTHLTHSRIHPSTPNPSTGILEKEKFVGTDLNMINTMDDLRSTLIFRCNYFINYQ